ncbi:hypothetical protein [Mycobacterium sp. 1245852.3]|uniref:hypothetical protein n=1 Tax=Mycobacterium sp. 1245852.3 TaxID=1856860 RepID=UPI0007FFEA3B|nr:hypothetical protein [Mycobacterium sp. 1245852.3]OBK03151.1 hypothetical protein A9W96_15955 [Mycobacterium sp. 1245852.3]
MTQPDPNLAAPPNPARAEVLRKLEVPPNLPFWAAFVDFQLEVAENGVPKAREASYTPEAVDKLCDAQLETISVLLGIKKALGELSETLKRGVPADWNVPAKSLAQLCSALNW